jgi:outer membrane protein
MIAGNSKAGHNRVSRLFKAYSLALVAMQLFTLARPLPIQAQTADSSGQVYSESDSNNLPLRGLAPKASVQADGMPAEVVPVDDLSADDANPQSIRIIQPPLSALISIDKTVDPLRLDAGSVTPMGLGDVVQAAIRNNLNIGISDFNQRTRKVEMYSSMGKFLPDIALSYRYNYLKGKANVPFGQALEPLSFNNPFIITSAGFNYHAYRGGRILFGALQNRNNFRAARYSKHATVSDTLQTAAKQYYDLLLQEALLQIRVKAVETSEGQLRLNKDLKEGGLATNLEVLQAQTQLSQDRQALIDQQVARRESAINLAEFINANQGLDIVPADLLLQKVRIIAEEASPARLLQLAIDNRPELKQYEELRLAAKKQIMINASRLHPTMAFTGQVLGVGETLSKQKELVPITLAGATGVGGGATQGLAYRNRQITPLYAIGFNLNWNFEGLGTVDLANTYAAKLAARQAGLQQNQVLNQVTAQVRRSYLRALKTDRKIEEAVTQVRSANEELRLAQLRFQNGVGRNIDVLRAQQDYTQALLEKARAIVNFNTAQVDLLRDTGMITASTVSARMPVVR